MGYIKQNTQLILFDKIFKSITNNSTLSKYFNRGDIYEFEPLVKSNSFKGFPFIIVNVPSTEDVDFENLKRTARDKEFVVSIHLIVDYVARDKFTEFSNALINALETDIATYEKFGYYDLRIKLTSVTPEPLSQKTVVRGIFELSFEGTVKK